nr:acyl carrier protein [Bacteroides intestinalis]
MELQKFIEQFAEAIEVEVEGLSDETIFRNLEGWSSLSVMILIAFFDEEFEKEIGDSEIRSCITIKDLYNLAIA